MAYIAYCCLQSLIHTWIRISNNTVGCHPATIRFTFNKYWYRSSQSNHKAKHFYYWKAIGWSNLPTLPVFHIIQYEGKYSTALLRVHSWVWTVDRQLDPCSFSQHHHTSWTATIGIVIDRCTRDVTHKMHVSCLSLIFQFKATSNSNPSSFSIVKDSCHKKIHRRCEHEWI
jgi:hypothetical protein